MCLSGLGHTVGKPDGRFATLSHPGPHPLLALRSMQVIPRADLKHQRGRRCHQSSCCGSCARVNLLSSLLAVVCLPSRVRWVERACSHPPQGLTAHSVDRTTQAAAAPPSPSQTPASELHTSRMTCVSVSGLSWSATGKSIRSHFGEPELTGFVFQPASSGNKAVLVFATAAAATAALSLHGSVLQGHTLRVGLCAAPKSLKRCVRHCQCRSSIACLCVELLLWLHLALSRGASGVASAGPWLHVRVLHSCDKVGDQK